MATSGVLCRSRMVSSLRNPRRHSFLISVPSLEEPLLTSCSVFHRGPLTWVPEQKNPLTTSVARKLQISGLHHMKLWSGVHVSLFPALFFVSLLSIFLSSFVMF